MSARTSCPTTSCGLMPMSGVEFPRRSRDEFCRSAAFQIGQRLPFFVLLYGVSLSGNSAGAAA